ncbi:MAG: hypothetical protein JJ938_07925 [Roseicyclus sp.]|nr:hypothetical protein [Roseicyclus sp.]MBO6624793.1 hypothetical protein [Roseicyclus sp.]MBO6921513.1 hypothetical protein [Roseicyclus sp.]
MSDRADRPYLRPGRDWTTRRAILAILALQIAMAVVLAGRDLVAALPDLISPARQPTLDTPVAPGDQTRRFRPSDLPARPAVQDPARQTRLPDPGRMPSRLQFTAGADGILLLTGAIAPGDAARFEEALSDPDDSPSIIRLHSTGGSVADALAIGRAVRGAEIATVMEAGDICLSACPYILAGGVSRTVDDAAMVGVHQHYFGENTALPAFLAVEDIQRGQAEVMAHLDAMDVDVRVMRHAMATPPDEIYILLPEELLDYRMVFDPAADGAGG